VAHAVALAEWGLPVPVALVATAVAQSPGGVRGALESSGLFQVGDYGFAHARVNDRWFRGLSGLDGWRARRGVLLKTLAEAAELVHAGTIVALLQRLALEGHRAVARSILETVASDLSRLVGPEPRHVIAWARAARRLDRDVLARGVLEQGLSRSQGDRHLQREYALVLHALGATARAREVLQRHGREHPGDVHALGAQAEVEASAGAPAHARRLIEEGLAADPGSPQFLVALGRLAAQQGAADEADRCFEMALDAVPGSASVLNVWAEALAGEGRLQDAVPRLERAIGVEPWNARHHVDLARVHRSAGHLDQAREAVQAALQVDPGSPQGLEVRAEIEAAAGAWDIAGELAGAALAEAETSGIRHLLARIEEHRGRLTAAIPHLRRALRLEPARASLRQAWVALVQQIGRRVTASLAEFSAGLVPPRAAGVRGAAPGATGRAPWVSYADRGICVALIETADGALVALVERERRPVEGAVVSLGRVGSDGAVEECATGVTDETGETGLGSVERLGDFLMPDKGSRCRVGVRFPPLETEEG
jgi:tetratricopeptide (TPR) repeat protein